MAVVTTASFSPIPPEHEYYLQTMTETLLSCETIVFMVPTFHVATQKLIVNQSIDQ